MKLATLKLTHLPEKWLRRAVTTSDLLIQLVHYIVAFFGIISTFFALSILSAAKALLDKPDTLLSPSQYYELVIQAWENGSNIAFNIALIYIAFCFVDLGLKYCLNKQKHLNTTSNEVSG
ncbi:hypothetical protein [Vibrio sp. OPT18]|uniref:hypothetical protein n=1 Tax=Vibrio sp. OPT18 TaxID=2778641 RepID=UPI0018820565|nr:hypothetical protein [Vibrio sp. OPT18]MBE8574114.1 hypothetical protein [Vibrio sp. OPT18]